MMRKLPLHVWACIMPFCLNSHGDCILYKSALHHSILGYFNPPVFLKLFLENSVYMQQVRIKIKIKIKNLMSGVTVNIHSP